MSDGRHYKRFWLVSPDGRERLAVAGLDSARRDRRYKYAAVPSLGGFAFENSREVLDWLTFVLDRPADSECLSCWEGGGGRGPRASGGWL